MGWHFIAPLIVFLFWYAIHLYSDDASAIESIHSSEGDNRDASQKQEAERKSKNGSVSPTFQVSISALIVFLQSLADDARFESTRLTSHRRID